MRTEKKVVQLRAKSNQVWKMLNGVESLFLSCPTGARATAERFRELTLQHRALKLELLIAEQALQKENSDRRLRDFHRAMDLSRMALDDRMSALTHRELGRCLRPLRGQYWRIWTRISKEDAERELRRRRAVKWQAWQERKGNDGMDH